MAPLGRIALVMLLAGVVHADEDARIRFDSGRRHFDLAEYDAALEDFKEGYRLKDDPVFLYNIGLCHRLLGHKSEALRMFKNYLSLKPDAPNREDLERRISALESELASEARAKAEMERPPLPSEAPPPPKKTPFYKRWWLWTAVGGAVAVGLGVGLGVGLRSEEPNRFPQIGF